MSSKTRRKASRSRGLSLSVLIKRVAGIVYGNAPPNTHNSPKVFVSPKKTLTRSYQSRKRSQSRQRF